MSLKLFKPAMGFIALALMFAAAPVEAVARAPMKFVVTLEVARQPPDAKPPDGTVVWRPAAGNTAAATAANAAILFALMEGDTIEFHLISPPTTGPHSFRVANNFDGAVVPTVKPTPGVPLTKDGRAVLVGKGKVVVVISDPLTANTDYRSYCTLHSPDHPGPTFSTIRP